MIPKFRVWCKNRKEWERDVCYIQQDGLLYQRSKGSERLIPILPKNHVVMQSTGLKDKNGVEIFEGDIFAEGFGRYVVAWEAKGGRWSLKFIHDFEDAFHLGIRNSKEMTLIGNIYENPELLEVEQ